MVIFLSVIHLTRWYDASLHDSKATNSCIYKKTCSIHNNTMFICQLANFLEVSVRCRLRELVCWMELFSVWSNVPHYLEVICQWSYFCIILLVYHSLLSGITIFLRYSFCSWPRKYGEIDNSEISEVAARFLVWFRLRLHCQELPTPPCRLPTNYKHIFWYFLSWTHNLSDSLHTNNSI